MNQKGTEPSVCPSSVQAPKLRVPEAPRALSAKASGRRGRARELPGHDPEGGAAAGGG